MLLFVVGVAVSIGLHELGHLIPGKLFNVKVTQYFVGFGRTLWSRQKGETEYGVKAIPLGGYCKLVGMLPPDPDDPETGTDRVRSRNTGMFAQLVSDARTAEYEHVDAARPRPAVLQQAVVAARDHHGLRGAINIVLAFVLFAVVFIGLRRRRQPTTTVAGVSQCVIAVTKANVDQPPRACTAADPEAPAKAAGFRPGDRDRLVQRRRDRRLGPGCRSRSAPTATATAVVVVERDGKRRHPAPDHHGDHARTSTRTTPSRSPRSASSGVVPTQVTERQGLGYVVDTMANGTWQTLQAHRRDAGEGLPRRACLVGLEQRDPNGPMSVVGAGRVAGEVASQHEAPVLDRFFSVILLLAGLNLFLGLINLVPLPPFDGGGIAATLYETVRRGSPGCAASPTRAASTAPSCCRSPT